MHRPEGSETCDMASLCMAVVAKRSKGRALDSQGPIVDLLVCVLANLCFIRTTPGRFDGVAWTHVELHWVLCSFPGAGCNL